MAIAAPSNALRNFGFVGQFSGLQYPSIADPGNAGAIPVGQSALVALTSAGAETRTIAAPKFMGQHLDIICDTYVGNIVVTVSAAFNVAGNTVITFGAAGHRATLTAHQIGGALRWKIGATDGATLS